VNTIVLSLNRNHEEYIRLPEITKVPVVFCLNDVAPKNIIVNVSTKRIMAFIDMEWAGPSFLGEDIMEMDYPLHNEDENTNESFTDSREVDYAIQSAYVIDCWKKYGIHVPYISVQNNMGKLINKLLDLFETEDQEVNEDLLMECIQLLPKS